MSPVNRNTQETEIPVHSIIISSTVDEPRVAAGKIVKICWNTGEEKNCSGCYLSKGCKAKS
jgi:hypothetical protein